MTKTNKRGELLVEEYQSNYLIITDYSQGEIDYVFDVDKFNPEENTLIQKSPTMRNGKVTNYPQFEKAQKYALDLLAEKFNLATNEISKINIVNEQ